MRDRPAGTADGTRVQVMLNVGLGLELGQLAATGADGIGLFRTEIAMLARGSIPDVAEQAALYARVMDAAGDLPVIFRTLDLGADKMMPGDEAPEEENPAMGWRSLRVGLDRPAVLRRQLRALLLAAGGRPLSVMFPMVATVAEFRAAEALLRAEARRVSPAPERLAIGTMLEVPALLWQLPELLKAVDFISVGSNDLMQFLFAADRGTPALSGRYDLLSPPVLDLLDYLLAAAGARGTARSGIVVRRGGGTSARGDGAGRAGSFHAVDAGDRRAAGKGPAGGARSGGVPSGPRVLAPLRGRVREPAGAALHLGARARTAGLGRDLARLFHIRRPISGSTGVPHAGALWLWRVGWRWCMGLGGCLEGDGTR